MKRLTLLLLTLCLISTLQGHAQHPDSIGLGRRAAHKAIQIGTGAVVTVSLTEILKAGVSEMRPDRSADNSFPSRHTSWAFAAASVVANELYRHSPWWVLGSQAVATGVGFQRVMAERHYPGDVLAGAAIGLGSMQLGYWIGDLFYPEMKSSLPYAENEQCASLAFATEAVLPLNHPRPDLHFRAGLGSRATASLPFSENLALQASVHLQTLPLMNGKHCFDMLNSLGLSAGAEWRCRLSQRWAGHARGAIGGMRNLNVKDHRIGAGTFRLDLGAGADYRLTPALSIGADLGYALQTYGHACSAINFGLVSKAKF